MLVFFLSYKLFLWFPRGAYNGQPINLQFSNLYK